MHRLARATALAAMIIATAGVQAHAQSTPARIFVKRGNLDLSSPADARTFYKRLQIAAAQVCGGTTSDFAGDRPDQLVNCYQETLAGAVADAGAPLVTAQ